MYSRALVFKGSLKIVDMAIENRVGELDNPKTSLEYLKLESHEARYISVLLPHKKLTEP